MNNMKRNITKYAKMQQNSEIHENKKRRRNHDLTVIMISTREELKWIHPVKRRH
jgi:hypothetical protein